MGTNAEVERTPTQKMEISNYFYYERNIMKRFQVQQLKKGVGEASLVWKFINQDTARTAKGELLWPSADAFILRASPPSTKSQHCKSL
jgi:hypothetical protein